MVKNNTQKILLTLIFILFLVSCNKETLYINRDDKSLLTVLKESDVRRIPLIGQVAQKTSEISGLAWYNNKLIILPQFPNIFDNQIGKIFYLEKNEITDYLSGRDSSPLQPEFISIDLSNYANLFGIGSGFESVTFIDESVYFTIESLNQGQTETHLISGEIDILKKVIVLDAKTLVKDPAEIFIHNISDESILAYDNKIIPIYELFGGNINKNPNVSVFDRKLNFLRKIEFPTIEYRITDVTSVDDSGRFWAINYFYPPDKNKLNPAEDILLKQFGIGQTHQVFSQIERIVEFQIKNDDIYLTDQPPVYLKLETANSRNWEGLAKLDDDGFLIVSDTHPETILAFIKK